MNFFVKLFSVAFLICTYSVQASRIEEESVDTLYYCSTFPSGKFPEALIDIVRAQVTKNSVKTTVLKTLYYYEHTPDRSGLKDGVYGVCKKELKNYKNITSGNFHYRCSCVGGRTYSNLHTMFWTVFNAVNNQGEIVHDIPMHQIPTTGSTRGEYCDYWMNGYGFCE